MNHFSNGLGFHMPCESFDGFLKTETHLRARDDCHVSTFSGRGVTLNLIFQFLTLLCGVAVIHVKWAIPSLINVRILLHEVGSPKIGLIRNNIQDLLSVGCQGDVSFKLFVNGLPRCFRPVGWFVSRWWSTATIMFYPSLIIWLWARSSTAAHFLRVKQFVGLSNEPRHINYINTIKGVLHAFIIHSFCEGLNRKIFIRISHTRIY